MFQVYGPVQQFWTREQLKRALGKLDTFEVKHYAYSGDSLDRTATVDSSHFERGTHVDLDELLEAFGISDWKDWQDA